MDKVIFTNKKRPYSPKKAKLCENLKEVLTIIEDAHYAYEIWWLFISREGRKKYFKTILHYQEFFQPVSYATGSFMIISLYKLYEYGDNTLSLENILKEAEKLNIIDLNYRKKLRRNLAECRLLWKKICFLRSNLLAHRSYKLTRTEIYGKANIRPAQIKRLIDLSLKIFNSLWVKFDNKPIKIEELTLRDTVRVLEALVKIG